ncbi:signal transduction histidine kinase/predicted ATPase [Actinoplanes campanulatus]|uniref:histidine kinase n=1 Tax=Actinoplanes campanulatus TaxID=113559 RepID=A0A7W5ALC3_9ACTN|nr:AAA family ATPase [Actinoplanes campanulatus]MBB3098210.1 signal transduction histidine kinase/predicted ATPase [Actinoplanes campanulatus]GGN34939.1 hypothetical protein GCM10010109_58460 [Actinoplanes campanulatus]GID38832.1 hypothetical protein Aca09nite_53380 [Actinoplanes campanulatus]
MIIRYQGEESLYLSDRTQVTRHISPAGPGVVCKHAAGPGAAHRIEHERAVLEKLAGLPGVPRPAAHQPRRTLVMQDDGGAPPPAGPMPLPDLARTAHALATTLAGVHRAGVLHRDITPANVLLRSHAPPLLIDFDLAVTGTPEAGEGPVGTPGFLPPEQTGRSGLGIDRRADLYGLGATLYALATGVAPVTGRDPLELMHATLVGTPAAPGLPPRLGDIIMRLLEKDPDRRYQSAEGLAHDLTRWTADPDGDWELGERDFPPFLPAPPTLVGRDRQLGTLTTALDRALAGDGRAVLVSGPPGIGKSALLRTLRPLVAAHDGWFLAGKYEQFGTGVGGALVQVVGGLARRLLALPETELEGHRERLAAALGEAGQVLSEAAPEVEVLLGGRVTAEPPELVTPPAWASDSLITLLRTVAVHRPLVVVVDDLQWAGRVSLRVLDGLVTVGPVPGVLVVCAYRDEEVDAGHPLASLVSRWERDGLVAPPLRLTGLDRAGLAELTGAVLRAEPAATAALADLIGTASAGNPYATVELINGLRTEGLLRPAEAGWDWDPDPVRDFVTRHHLPQLLTTRLAQQSPATRRLLVALTCLGSGVPPELLATATATQPDTLPAHLAPAVTDGLISVDSTVTFCHDLVLRAARDLLPAVELDRARLAMARRLAAHDGYEQQAAEQYLEVPGLIGDDGERRTAAALLHRAGRRAARTTNYPVADELLAAADRMLATADAAADRDAIAVDRHATLYCLGRHADADRIYHDLAARSPDPLTLAAATAVQINSLTVRGECRAAIALGLDALRRFDITPPADLVADNQRTLLELRDWVAAHGPAYPARESTDPRIIAVARILRRMTGPAYLIDRDWHAWLVLQMHTLWQHNGVCEPLAATLGLVIRVTTWLLDDYRTGYLLTGYALRAAREHGYHTAAAGAAYQHLMLAAPWFEPLEEVVESCWQVRDDLLAVGDVQLGVLHWALLLILQLETEDSLETCAEDTAAALAFAERSGNRHTRLFVLGHRQLIRALRGQGSFAAEDFDETAHLKDIDDNLPALAGYHLDRALAALLGDDTVALEKHSAEAMRYCDAFRGFYGGALARVTRCLSDPSPATTDARDWLARRATDAPRNFRPLLLLVDAEIARAEGDAAAALRLFDTGLHEVTGRPWHHALLAERAARLHLEQGLTHTGRRLLAEARDAYRAWGAGAPVARLETAHPFLRNTASGGSDSRAADHLDLMAILRAARALSSQTTLAGLSAQVTDVLCAMTGATDVCLSLRNRTVSSGCHTDLPSAAVRYVQRTHQPLLVADATHDDRFAHDPYLADLEACSLLVLPVPCHSAEDAVLVLANRRQRGVFSTSRLQTVELIAGQLAVSLDNALLYDSLENEVRARTAELADRNRDLEAAGQLKSDLIGMLGHEINNPLGTIFGYLDLILTDDPLPPSAEELVVKVQHTTRRLAGIVDEVLALVSIDAGRLTAAPRPVRVADHIEAALATTTAVTVSCPPDLTAAVQPGHLDQILANLISNAAKYGGGVETIDAHASDGGPVTIDVTDRGPGVPPEFRDRLFDRFARAESTAGKAPGTGLGLYIVRELARANGGDVRYRPSPRGGSVFVISLPPASGS